MSIFTEAVKTGRSLIFVQGRHAHDTVCAALRIKLVPYFSTYEFGATNALVKYMSYLPKTVALVCVVPALTTGVKINADRIIWIPGASYPVWGSVYQQAMGRARNRLVVTPFVIQEDEI